jgi:hypothetical protein
LNFRVAEPLRFFNLSEVLVFPSALLCFHRNEFNLDPGVEGRSDSGERAECDISCGSLDERYFRSDHPRLSRKLRLIRFSVIGSVGFSLRIFVRVAPKPAG